MAVTHKPKSGALLTGTEYEAADSHVVSLAHTDLSGVTANQHHAQSHTQTDHTGTGATSTQAFGDAAADGTGTKPANIDHKHGMPANPAPSFATPAIVLGTAAGAGVAATVIRSDATIVAFDATVPTTSAVGDAAAAGSAAVTARRDHLHGREAFGASAAAVGTSSAGAATTPSRSDHVHATGAGTPTTSAVGDVAATGAGPAAAMTNHVHGREAFGATAAAVGTSSGGAAATPSRSDHVHATGAGTPSTSARGDAAATGTGPAASMTDHKHARATATNKFLLTAAVAKLDVATAVNLGASANLLGAVAYADAATQGAFWTFEVPADWASGVITIQPVWSPGATDGVAHTVRWSMTCKTLAAGVTVTAAGTTVAFTGSSAARTIAVLVYDTATSTTLTPAAAGDLFMIELQRIGADAADTYVGVVNLVGIIVSYTANT